MKTILGIALKTILGIYCSQKKIRYLLPQNNFSYLLLYYHCYRFSYVFCPSVLAGPPETGSCTRITVLCRDLARGGRDAIGWFTRKGMVLTSGAGGGRVVIVYLPIFSMKLSSKEKRHPPHVFRMKKRTYFSAGGQLFNNGFSVCRAPRCRGNMCILTRTLSPIRWRFLGSPTAHRPGGLPRISARCVFVRHQSGIFTHGFFYVPGKNWNCPDWSKRPWCVLCC